MTGKIIRSRLLRDRRRSVRRDRLRTFTRRTTGTVLILATIGAGAAVAGSSLFSLDGVVVSGARSVTADRVREVAALRKGSNVLTLDLDAARRRVEAIEEIKTVEVRRAGALGIRINVVERTPAVVVRAGNSRRYFDEDGIELKGPAKGRVPLIRLAPETRTMGDGRVLNVLARPSLELISGVLRVWAAAGETRDSITRFDASTEGLTALAGGVRITLGDVSDRSDVRAKMSALTTIRSWAETNGERLRSVNLTVPEHPAIRVA